MRRYLTTDVLTAAKRRIAETFDQFDAVYLSFSGGKDSTVMLHLVMAEAIARGRKIGLLFVDLEAQYSLTIEHVQQCFDHYRDHIIPYWIALPLHLRNAVSVYEPHWICWEPDRKADWVRTPPAIAITDQQAFPFFRAGMEFEEFVEHFGHWYGAGALTACCVGIRTQESLNRWRTVTSHRKSMFQGISWTTWLGASVYNVYPIYDWQTEDIWTFHGKTGLPHNRLYDLMHKAGVPLHNQRICQPYGDDQRRGLWLFHLIEPQTWAKIVARVNGANQGALYARESGNILGIGKITCPEGHTWQSFAQLLLKSMPEKTAEHYRNKITVFLKWWADRGYETIADELDPRLESGVDGVRRPSWRRICKTLLKNDYWCKGLSFSQTKSDAYERYKSIMNKRKQLWGINV